MNDLLNRSRARLKSRRPNGDAGTTLIELMIGMAIMAIFMSIFTGAVVMMTSTANRVEAVTNTSVQTSQAFLNLDKTVRYASAITTPAITATGTGDWYVEFETTTSGDVCTQLRVDKTLQQLQRRTWTVNSGAASSWVSMATNIKNGTAASGSTTAPFAFAPAVSGASTLFQRLRITLVSTSGNASTSTTQSQMTFTALNSTVATTTTVPCQQWGRP
jgi:prepilin-type N-terminal cleavage/methylation domain-containing protein